MSCKTFLSTLFTSATFTLFISLHCKTQNRIEPDTKLILTWIPFFRDKYYGFGNGQSKEFEAAGCSFTNCEITSDRHRVPLTEYGALLFHGNQDSEIWYGTPLSRSQKQIYVFVSLESAFYTNIPAWKKNLYNMTVTYRLDSDLPWPYFVFKEKGSNEVVAPSINPKWYYPDKKTHIDLCEIDNKNKMAVWFVSHCSTQSGREKFAERLRYHGIDFDVFGSCGNYSCPTSKQDECNKIINQYYFQFSFENTLCEDYVTEKTRTAYIAGAVPVVFSGANLSRFLPPGSYLDAYKLGPEALAKEMKRLILNKEEYARMFWWRQRYKITSRYRNGWKKNEHIFCKLCEAINTGVFKTERTLEVSEWWSKKSDGFGSSCITGY